MKKNGCSRWGLCGGLFALALLCSVGISFFYFQGRAKAFNSRPLVLIHSPINHDRVEVGDGVLVHATAREDNGLRRIELWADDQLIAARDVSESVTNLTLSSHWIPEQTGAHVLIARAISADGVEGQSTVTVQVPDSGELEPQTHTFQEGETLDSIAADHDVSLDDLSASNPDLGSAAPGDELIIPDDDPPAAQEGESPDAGDSPAAVGDAPGSEKPWFGDMGGFENFSPGEPITLRLEVLELRTSDGFDSLHCYVGLADSSPVWFPDADNDQTTDESFAPLSGGEWDVASYLAGDAAPVISWPENRPLPLNISCVGIAGGGTEALELGRVELSIPPEDWGSPQSVETDGEGGHLFLQYRVTRAPHGFLIDIDHSMTPPTNVRLDHSRNSLRWDYSPDLTRDPPEEPAYFFRIYMNGNLQWAVNPDIRETRLPYEWFHPPCGGTYTFEVTAVRMEFSDEMGPPEEHESNPDLSAARVTTPFEGCTYEIEVKIESLETFDLGGDGDNQGLWGVGPIYGSFFANEEQIHFGSSSSDLLDYDLYDLSRMPTRRSLGLDGPPILFVDVPREGTLELGFDIMDDDVRKDDPVCKATTGPQPESVFKRWQEGVLRSDDGRCQLRYSFGPAFDSPVGAGMFQEPYPQIDVETVRVDLHAGKMQVRVRNNGRATWASRNFWMNVSTREGLSIEDFVVENFILEARRERVLEFSLADDGRHTSEDVCVIVDSHNLVPELDDAHQPFCTILPDLIISSVQFDRSDETGTLKIRTQNVGEGNVRDRRICFQVTRLDGVTPMTEPFCDTATISMEPGESHSFTFFVDDGAQALMQYSYIVIVNPSTAPMSFGETNTANNYHSEP